MKFSVQIIPQAEEELFQILSWIHQRSPEGAVTWRQSWLKAIDQLEQTADQCSLAPENERHTCEVRQLIFRTKKGKPYRILLTIRNQTAYILHIRGPGQNLLKKRDLRLPPSEY